MRSLLTTLIECSVAMSVLILLFIAITPLLEKRYAAKWRYYAWLVIVLGLVIPFRPHLDTAFIQVDVPVSPSGIQQIMSSNAETVSNKAIGSDTDQRELPTIPWYQLAGYLWITGAFAVIAYHTLRHRRFIRMLNRWGEEITNQQMLDTLQRLKDDMGISKQVKLQVCSCITSTMLIGFFRHVVLLPSTKIASDELALILRHELVHLKRNDLWYKALVLLATAVHWFNPVVYIMAKAIAAQCEISCDELVLQGTSFQQRKQYGETIIGVVRNGAKLQTALSTNFYGGKKGMKTRIFLIMDTTKKKAGITILCVALIATIGIGMALGIAGCSSVAVKSDKDQKTTSAAAQLPSMQTSSKQDLIKEKIVLIDPGHGGVDTGAICIEGDDIKIKEKELNLKISLLLQDMLKESGVRVELTRQEDQKISLEDRMELAENLNASLLLSVHFEYNPDRTMKGTWIQYNSSNDAAVYGITGQKAARLIHDIVVKELETKGGKIAAMPKSVKYDSLKMPVVSIAPAVMTNDSDRKRLMTEEFSLETAKALHDGIIAVLNEM